MGLDIGYFSNLVGIDFSVLMGGDILNTFDYVIDLENEKIIFSNDSIYFPGSVLRSHHFKGIPIFNAKIEKGNFRLFFDTGAKISYLKSDIAPDFPVVGQETDFYPGMGEFQVDIHKFQLSLGEYCLPQEMGILPQNLEIPLEIAGVDGILGTSIFDSFKVCVSASRKQIIFQKYT